jgi:hypothetical protein
MSSQSFNFRTFEVARGVEKKMAWMVPASDKRGVKFLQTEHRKAKKEYTAEPLACTKRFEWL